MSTFDSFISQWSTTPANNGTGLNIVPYGAPEGWQPNEVNNVVRQHMTDQRYQWTDAEWVNHGHTISVASASSFKVNGSDVTSLYLTDLRLKILDTTTLYGTVVSSSFSTDTTVNVTLDSGSLASASKVALAIIKPTNNSLPGTVFGRIAVQRITTSGAGTYTPTTGMIYVIVCAQGAGGGAGGCADPAGSQFAFGAGGGGGEYIEAVFSATQIGASKAYSVGAKGTGGATGNNNGTAGGNTTFNTTWIVATGGGLGTGGASAAGSQVFLGEQNQNNGGSGGSVATGTLIKQVVGGAGREAYAFAASGISSGGGASGSGLPGANNQAITTATSGLNGTLGEGGSGAGSYNTTGTGAGGDGGDGFITFIEFLSIS